MSGVYRRRAPETEPLYQVMAGHLETFLEGLRTSDRQLPSVSAPWPVGRRFDRGAVGARAAAGTDLGGLGAGYGGHTGDRAGRRVRRRLSDPEGGFRSGARKLAHVEV